LTVDKKKNKMKKIFLTTAITLCLAFGAMAQNDGFFSDWSNGDSRDGDVLPTLPEGGMTGNQSPVGSGLLILTALGAGYACLKRRD